MGNDVDDVVALDMLYKYQDAGKIDLLGIISSKREEGSVKFIDAMNTLYGYPNIPIGIVKHIPRRVTKIRISALTMPIMWWQTTHTSIP